MSYGLIAFLTYIVGFNITASVLGWLDVRLDRTSIEIEEVGKILFGAAIWPLFWIISTPILARKLRNYVHNRRAAREARRVRVEAEAKALHNKELRSAHLRPQRRRLDLSE